MTIQSEIISLCSELSDMHSDLIFWKHFDRAIDGYGDIDSMLINETKLDQVSTDVVKLIFSKISNVQAVVTCGHLSYARLHFAIVEGMYPRLFEFDIGVTAKRFGITWLISNNINKYVVRNDHGVSVLSPGSQAVVLLALYGITWHGKNILKPHDYKSVIEGIHFDRDCALEFCDDVLPVGINQLFKELINEIYLLGWSELIIRKIWRNFFSAAINKVILGDKSEALELIVNKWGTLCNVRELVIKGNRTVPQSDWKKFINQCICKEHTITLSPYVGARRENES